MKKIAFMFPGQGSQYVGMGRELYQHHEIVQDTLNTANKILGYDLTHMMFEGPAELLTQTQYTQPAVFSLSVAIYRILKEKNIVPNAVAGHSLGEYSAMVASGIIDFEQGLKIIQIRGELLQEAAVQQKGTMAAIIGLANEKIEEICRNIKNGVVEPVNYNCSNQLVIAGQTEAVQEAIKQAQAQGALKAIQLQVSGPFHSSLMQEAGKKLGQALSNYILHDPVIPVVANYNAKFLQNTAEAAQSMVSQVSSPVLWERSMQQLLDNGAEVFVEAGPGKVLCGLMKRIDRKVKCHNIEDEKTLQAFLQSGIH